MGPAHQQSVELVGANSAAVTIGAAPVTTDVTLDQIAVAGAAKTMGVSTSGETVSRLYVKLEGVKGTAPAPFIDIYVNLPVGEKPEDHPNRHAGSLSLFGLKVASDPKFGHGGDGLGYTLDITEVAQRLANAGELTADHIAVSLAPGDGVTPEHPVTIEKVSVVKRSGTVG